MMVVEAPAGGQHDRDDAAAARSAILLDRDGTLIRDDGFTHRPEDLEWLPGAVQAIRYANDRGWLVIVVTNQSGIARGLYGAAEMHAFHAAMQNALAVDGAHIDAFYHCPYHPDGTIPELAIADHPDRKPEPGMLRRAIIAWSLDTERSIMIGDRASDVEAGQALGMRTALVTPGGLLDAVETAILDAPAPGAAGLTAALQSAAQHWRGWLFETALPLWLDVGFDRENGCFHERLSLDGQPVSMPRRIRVQARQLYVYARAGQLGWTGPWEQAVEAALEVLLTKGLRADGGTRYALDECGAPSDNRRDLYDLAFVLLGFAQAIMVRPGDHRPVAAARALTGWLDQNWAHPQGGYYEGDIVSADVRRQNPHMHLFEAFLALFEATGDNLYRQRALDMAHLGRDRMFQSAGGAIPEYFETDWRPSTGDAGVVIEPGHQFEWSYLFNRLDGLVGGGWQDVAEVLRVTGEVYGVDPATGMVFEEVLLDGRPKTGSSRLWTHAERIKAHLARMRRGPDAAAALAVLQGQAALMDFCNAAGSALWLERRDEAGRYVGQDVLASSFYHIMGAAEDLIADRAGGAR